MTIGSYGALAMQLRRAFGLRMPNDIKLWITRSARAEGRSVNNFILWIISKEIASRSGGDPKPQTCQLASRGPGLGPGPEKTADGGADLPWQR